MIANYFSYRKSYIVFSLKRPELREIGGLNVTARFRCVRLMHFDTAAAADACLRPKLCHRDPVTK